MVQGAFWKPLFSSIRIVVCPNCARNKTSSVLLISSDKSPNGLILRQIQSTPKHDWSTKPVDLYQICDFLNRHRWSADLNRSLLWSRFILGNSTWAAAFRLNHRCPSSQTFPGKSRMCEGVILESSQRNPMAGIVDTHGLCAPSRHGILPLKKSLTRLLFADTYIHNYLTNKEYV